MTYQLPELPYAYEALEPYIDRRTMEIHHTKHHAAYVTNLNKAIEGRDLGHPTVEELVAAIDTLPAEIRPAVRNHGGGHANHSLFWETLTGDVTAGPGGDLAVAIDEQLGGFESFRGALTTAAMRRFGSGWAWLCLNEEKRLVVEDTPNQDSPLMQGNTPILGIDIWEHAYYLKYQNRRADYIEAFFHIVNWHTVSDLYHAALARATHVIVP